MRVGLDAAIVGSGRGMTVRQPSPITGLRARTLAARPGIVGRRVVGIRLKGPFDVVRALARGGSVD